MKKIAGFAKLFFGWPLSFIALFFIGKILIANKEILRSFSSLNFFLLVASLFAFLCYFLFRSFFWQLLLKKKGLHHSFKETAFLWGTTEMRRYIPGNIWSILSRHNAYREKGSDTKQILSHIISEVEFLLAATLFLSLLSFNFLFFGFFKFPFQLILEICTASIVTTLLFLFLFHNHIQVGKKSFLRHLLPQLKFLDMLQLFAVMTAGFLFFGLGTYFSISALFPLYALHILPLVGFFIFSYLIGYLSFITPVGLGVREAFLTAGLAKYIPLGASAFTAIFSRVILILAELLFLILITVWVKVKNIFLKRLERFLSTHTFEAWLTAGVALYIVYFSLASFLKFTNFFTGRFDLGNMDQTVWNTINGRFFQLTNPDGTNIISRLAFHADFMLVVLAPLYLIWQDPRMLLLLQSIALGCGAFFVYVISQQVLKSKKIALSFAFSFLMYPAINHANLFDFHSVTLAVPLLLGAFYYSFKKKYWITSILLFLAGLTKEEVWIITGIFGLYLLFARKQKLLGTTLASLSFFLFYFIFWKAIPATRGSQHFALSYFSEFGATPSIVLKNIALSPVKLIQLVFGKWQLIYIAELFAPLLFLSFLSPLFLLFIVPELAIDLLSTNAQLHSIQYHYAAIFTPFVFLSSIYGLKKLLAFFPKLIKYGPYVILIPAFVAAYIYGPLPGALKMNDAMFDSQLSYRTLIDEFLDSIPHRYSIASTNNVGSHLSHRQRIYTLPVGLKDADVVVFLLTDPYAQPSLKAQREMAKQLDNNSDYEKLFSYRDFVVYKKKSIPTLIKRARPGVLPLFKGS